MSDFFQILMNPSLNFFRYALIAGLLASPAFGIIGSFVVVNRITYIAGAVSHASLAGIGIALYVGGSPLLGAVISAMLAGLIISLVSQKGVERSDTVIGTIWAVGMGIGLLFINKSGGYTDPMSYLFGNILLISRSDLFMLAVLDIIVIALGLIFYRQFQAISFDEEFARARGIPTTLYQVMMTLLISLTVVLMVTVVGIVMVIALLTIPAATASLYTKDLKSMMVWSALLCGLFNILGLWTSYSWDFPTGATTIVIAGLLYFLMLPITAYAKKKKQHNGRKAPRA
ncbi:MAG: metal ABC transporter permease [Spirochaetales bacterium]|nr:metal ABC transporter permease [Spirochaetales bacterium]